MSNAESGIYANNPVGRLIELLRTQSKDIYAIYFYAILAGLIQLSLPVGIQTIINLVLGGALSTSVVLLIIFVVGGVLVTGLMQIAQMRIIEKIHQQIFLSHTMKFSDSIPRVDLIKTDGIYLPELVNRFFEIPALQKSLSKVLLDIPTASIQIVFGLMLLCLYHPVFIIFGVLLLFLLWLILYYTGRNGLRTSLTESSHKYQVAAWLQEMARVVKSFKFSKGSRLHLERADDKTSRYLRARTAHFRILLLQYRTLVVFKVIITAALFIIGVLLLLRQQLTIGQFVAAEIIIITVISSVEKLIQNLESVYDILTSLEKIGKLTDKPLEITGEYPLASISKGVALEVRKLSFGYSHKHIIHDISFSVMPGERICITGKEGSGKSTLLKLIAGSYLGYSGNILVDNIPLGNYDLASIRAQTGILLSQQEVFTGTLWENVTMGNPAIPISEVTELFEITGLVPFLSTLKEGFHSELQATGKGLPGNVVHKILLCRALLNRPRLLLLENPFALLEEAQRKQVHEFIFGEQNMATVLFTTSDIREATYAHKIISLDEINHTN